MRFSTIRCAGKEVASVATPKGLVLIETINSEVKKDWPTDMQTLIQSGGIFTMNQWYRSGGKAKVERMEAIPFDTAEYAPLIRKPAKIFGIGLNYADHAKDLNEQTPTGFPGSFFKPYTTIIGPGDAVNLPLLADVCDGEGELAIIMGKEGKNIPAENWLDYVAGFTVSTDMTSLDILKQNTRFLTISKSFDTFFGLSHQLITPDEIENIMELKVRTVINGEVFAENFVKNMTFSPQFLVSFLSQIMTWLPGDIISTGTPRGVHIHDGDVIEGQVDGFSPLKNPVVDLKLH